MRDTDDPTTAELQAHEERAIFECFVESVGLAVAIATIESCEPPAPDILCQMTDGEWVAFELGELSDEGFRHAHGKMMEFRRLLHERVDALPVAVRARFLHEFRDARIDVDFNPAVSMHHFPNAILELYTWLVDRELKNDVVMSSELPRSIANAIGAVKITRHRPQMIEPSLGMRVLPPPIALITKKAKARYVTEHPIELLLHSFFPLPDAWIEEYGQRLRDMIDASSFRRLWVFSPSERTTSRALKLEYRRNSQRAE